MNSSVEQEITRALTEAARNAPPPQRLAVVSAQCGLRRVKRRRAALVAVGVAAIVVSGTVAVNMQRGGDVVAPARNSKTQRVAPDLIGTVELDCRDASGKDHGVNSGSPDSVGEGDPATPLQQALRWAQSSGFASRFPEVAPTRVGPN